MMTKTDFSRLARGEKYILLCDLGKHLANRKHSGFIVSLFEFEGFYVEVWKRVGLDYVDYIEVINDNSILEQYLDDLDLGTDLGLI
tara:strand:+ start:96 stop:353 length:258 start_codon:yes stop_codon:yes gene_type:complete